MRSSLSVPAQVLREFVYNIAASDCKFITTACAIMSVVTKEGDHQLTVGDTLTSTPEVLRYTLRTLDTSLDQTDLSRLAGPTTKLVMLIPKQEVAMNHLADCHQYVSCSFSA
jgi:hypothetical protein